MFAHSYFAEHAVSMYFAPATYALFLLLCLDILICCYDCDAITMLVLLSRGYLPPVFHLTIG